MGVMESNRLIETWLLGTGIVGVLEWLSLVLHAHEGFRDTRQIVSMLGLELGNFLPYTLLASLFWVLCDAARRALAGKVRRPELALSAGAFVLALPYTGWLASYTFSGPQAKLLPFREVALIVLALVLALSFAVALWLDLRAERSTSAKPLLQGAGLALGTLILLEINVRFLPNEYPPIHAFLGGWAILSSTLAARNFTRAVGALRLETLRAKAALAAAGSVCSFGAALILARADDYAWLLWGETGSSRYVTTRFTSLAPEPDDVSLEKLGPFRPNVENDAAKADRERRRKERAPNIVIFSIDGLRTDHVGAYGYKKHPTTPNIDRFAARGVLFTRAYSHYPATQNFNSALLLGRFVPPFSSHAPPPDLQERSITRLLDQRGYHILVKSWFEHSSKNRFNPADYAIDTHLPKPKSKQRLEAPMEERLASVAAHLDEARAKDAPAFVWMHLLGTHLVAHDYVTHPDFQFGDSRMDRYDSAIAGTDLWLPHLERLVAERASPDRATIWVICSDHGTKEDSGTRDLSTGIVHVPLIVVAPGLSPRVEDVPVDVPLDLAATVVDWAGLDPPETYDGVTLLPVLRGDEAARGALRNRVIALANRRGWSGAIYGRFKYTKNAGAVALFDVTNDPEEKGNLAGDYPDLVRALGSAADREIARRIRAYRRRPKGGTGPDPKEGSADSEGEGDDGEGDDGEG
jgi:arylsulfatase A-like enzyme